MGYSFFTGSHSNQIAKPRPRLTRILTIYFRSWCLVDGLLTRRVTRLAAFFIHHQIVPPDGQVQWGGHPEILLVSDPSVARFTGTCIRSCFKQPEIQLSSERHIADFAIGIIEKSATGTVYRSIFLTRYS